MTNKVKFSEHMTADRMGRYLFIATKVGFGEVTLEAATRTAEGAAIAQLTSTGVLMIRGKKNIIVTMYLATVSQIMNIFKQQIIPREIIIAAKNNEKRNYISLQNNKF